VSGSRRLGRCASNMPGSKATPKVAMPISITAITSRTTKALIACSMSVLTIASAADEEGIANYASYLDKNYALQTAAAIEEQLASKVQINEVEIDGNTWLRLQSGPVDAIEAKSLVVRATAVGYPAWYQSTRSAPVHNKTQNKRDTSTTQAQTGIHNADPKLVAMLPEGPLLGELYPPRTPVQENSGR